MSERPANDIVSPARTVIEAYIIDPNTKRPVMPGALDNETFALLSSMDDQLQLQSTLLGTPATELPKRPLLSASDLTYAAVSRSGAGETTMVSATASQTTKLYRYSVTTPAAGTVEIRDGASGTALRKHVFPAAGGLVMDLMERPYAKTTANTALVFYWSGTGQAEIEFDHVKGV